MTAKIPEADKFGQVKIKYFRDEGTIIDGIKTHK